MNKHLIAILFILIPFSSLFGQEGQVWTMHVLVCDSMAKPITDVAVYNAKNNLLSVTDGDGVAKVTVRQGEMLYFSHLSFLRQAYRVDQRKLIDINDLRNFTIITLKAKANPLPEVTVTEHAPHLAYENEKVWANDFIVRKEGIFLIIDDPARHLLLFLDHEQDTLAQLNIKRKFDELYQDVFGNVHIISSDSVYQVLCDRRGISLGFGVSIETFRQKLEPVKALTDSIMVLQKYSNMQQELVYFKVNRNNSKISVMADVSGASLEMAQSMRNDAYRDQKIDQMLAENPLFRGKIPDLAMRENNIGLAPGGESNVQERCDAMKSLYMRILFKPIYCPVFYIKDSIYIFDFQNNEMLKYDNCGEPTGQCEIDFHETGYFKKSVVNKPWDKKLIVDAATGRCYAQFSTDGIVTLKEISLTDGKVKREIRLGKHSFPQNIQVYDGEVYYLYLDKKRIVDQDKRSLYKMKLE